MGWMSFVYKTGRFNKCSVPLNIFLVVVPILFGWPYFPLGWSKALADAREFVRSLADEVQVLIGGVKEPATKDRLLKGKWATS